MYGLKLISCFLIVAFNLIDCATINFPSGHHLVYNYETNLVVIDDRHDRLQFGLEMHVELHPKTESEYIVKIADVKVINEQNAEASPHVNELTSPFLVKKLVKSADEPTDYDIVFQSKESDDSINVKKGLVSLLEIEHKNAVQYELPQQSLQGVCLNRYISQKKKLANGTTLLDVHRTRDLESCTNQVRDSDWYVSVKYGEKIARLNGIKVSRYTLEENGNDLILKDAFSEETVRLNFHIFKNVTNTVVSTQKLHLIKNEKDESDASALFAEKPELHHSKLVRSTTSRRVANVDQTAAKLKALAGDLRSNEYPVFEKLNFIPRVTSIKEDIDVLSKEDLVKLFKENELPTRQGISKFYIYYTTLSLSTNFEATIAAMELTKENVEKGDENAKKDVITAMARYFQTHKIRYANFKKENGEQLIDFCSQEFVQKNFRLKKACYLALSRTIDQNCEKLVVASDECKLIDKDELVSKAISTLKLNATNDELLKMRTAELVLLVRTLGNMNFNPASHIVERVVENKQITLMPRIDAVWSLVNKVDQYIEKTLIEVLQDKSEDHELRLAAFIVLMKHRPETVIPVVMAAKESAGLYDEDKNFLASIYQSMRIALIKMPETDPRREAVSKTYNELNEAVEREYGHILDRFVFFDKSATKSYAAIVPSNRSLIPRTVHISIDDVERDSYTIRSMLTIPAMAVLPAIESGLPINADVEKSLANIVNQFCKSRPESQHGLEVIKKVGDYCTYFIYADEVTDFDPEDLEAFKRLPVDQSTLAVIKTSTESGFPITERVDHIEYQDAQRLTVKGSGGHVDVSARLPFTNVEIKSGRRFNKFGSTHVKVSFGMKKWSTKEMDMRLTVKLPQEEQEFHFEEMRNYHLISTNDNNNPIEIPPLDESRFKKFEHRFDTGVIGTTLTPYGKEQDNEITITGAFLDHKVSTTSMRTRHDYVRKAILPASDKPRELTFTLTRSFTRELTNSVLKVDSKDENLMEFIYNRKSDDETKTNHYSMKSIIKPLNHNMLTAFDVKYEDQIYDSLNPIDIVSKLKDAKITGKTYYTNDLDAKVDEEANVILSVEGTASKRKDAQAISELEDQLRCASRKKDTSRKYELMEDLLEFDKLTLNLDIQSIDKFLAPKLADGNNLGGKAMFKYYNGYYDLDYSTRTGDPSKFIIELEKIHEKRKTVYNYAVTDFIGRFSLNRFDANDYDFLSTDFPSVDYRIRENTFMHMYVDKRRRYCVLNENNVTTFDGRTHHLESSGSNENALLVADCTSNQFAVLVDRSERKVRLIYRNHLDVVWSEKALTVNGEAVEIADNELKAFGIIELYGRKDLRFIKLPGGDKVIADDTSIAIGITPSNRGKLCGVCGDFDGDWRNDNKAPNGSPVDDEHLVHAWVER